MSEQENLTDEFQPESLGDLELDKEEAENTKAGLGAHSSGGGCGAGKVSMRDD